MTNTILLEQKIAESGLKKKEIAQKLNLSPYGFAKKVSGQSDFKTEEVRVLCSLLGITSLREKDALFFAPKVDNKSTQEKEAKMGGKIICIEADSFKGNAIIDSMQQPYGGGLEHVEDHKTGKLYTVIQKGDHWYAYEEREDGSLIWPPKKEAV